MSTYDDASLIYYPSGYKAGTAYSLKPTDGSGDLDFTRASTATRVNAEGLIEEVATGVPRIDFTGGGCGSLILEPQRTNLIFPSATATTQTVTTTAQSYTLSFYGTGTVVRSGTSTGTLVGTGANDRVFVTFTATAGSLILTVTGSVTNWQLEAGAYSTSVIITTSTAVTRVRDSANKTGISSLINSTEGVLYAELAALTNGSGNRYLALSDNSNNERVTLQISSLTNIKSVVRVGGVENVNLTATVASTEDFNKIAIKYKANDYAFYVNGVLIDTSTSPLIFSSSTLNTLTFSVGGVSSFRSELKSRAVMVFPTALSDAELIALTTL